MLDMLKVVLGLNVPDPKHVKVFNAAKARFEREFDKPCRNDLAAQVVNGVRSPTRKKSKARKS